jgi:SpoIID/LytB domain protein
VIKKVFPRLFLILFFLFFGFSFFHFSLAEGCNEGDPELQQICLDLEKLEKERSDLSNATAGVESSLSDLESKIKNIQASINSATSKAEELEEDIFDREVDLEFQKQVLASRVRSYYKRMRQSSIFLLFLSSDNAAQLTRELSYRQTMTDEDKKIISKVSQELISLKNDKEELEKKKVSLASMQQNLDAQAAPLKKVLAEAKNYENQLSQKITELNSRQEALIAQKSGGFQTSIGDTPPTLEPCSGPPGSANFCSPGFSPGFAVFSFGAPHRTGMSQYGALGRSKSGQNAEQILSAYYQGTSLNKSYSVPGSITVTGIGTIPFEDNYLLGIYEVPESWGDQGGFEALKAQAVAARTYALAATNNGASSICATESCQVYKTQLKSGKWAEAVRATRGWVLIKDGSPAKTYYAASSGGFTLSNWGWSGIIDTVGGSRDAWPSQAYEKIGGSPWFYKGWYKSRGGETCGRGNPWLNQEEMADILNAVIVYRSGQGVEHILPVDYNSCFGSSGDPWSISQMRDQANSHGGAVTSVSSASVVYDSSGNTQTVNFSTNKGNFSISGSEFKTVFNLRAPARIAIKSGLFNIEKI